MVKKFEREAAAYADRRMPRVIDGQRDALHIEPPPNGTGAEAEESRLEEGFNADEPRSRASSPEEKLSSSF